MASREIFLRPVNFYPISNRFDVDWQWVMALFTPLFLAEFGIDRTLGNTQQQYSPLGRGGIVGWWFG